MAMFYYHITCESNFTDVIYPTNFHGVLWFTEDPNLFDVMLYFRMICDNLC